MISNQIQMMNKKIQSIVKKASSKGYEEATIIYQPFLGDCRGIDGSAIYVRCPQYAQLNDGLSIPEVGEIFEPLAPTLTPLRPRPR
jgi:hypothetical protein